MTSYVEKLQREVSIRSAQVKPHSPVQRASQHVPLDVQLEQLFRTIPRGEFNRPWHMDEFVTKLAGRYRERPHPRWIGQTLKARGWTQKRLWAAAYGGRRVWIAPKQSNLKELQA